MIVYVKLKALAKKKPVIQKTPMEIPDGIQTAEQLVESVVRISVREFNQMNTGQPIFPYLSKEELGNMEKLGKIGFCDRKNEQQQDEEEAVENALQCFLDGIFRIFINDEEAEYKEDITIKEDDEVTFVRLTMLSGRMW